MDKISDFESVLFPQSFHGIVCYDAQYRLLRANPALAQLLGLSALPEIGTSIFSFLPEDDLLKSALQNALMGHPAQLRNLAYRLPNDKTRLFLDANIAAWPHPSEALRRGIILLKESSEANSREKSLSRKRLKDALKAFDFSNDRLKCIINSTEDLIVAIDPHFRVTLFNEHFKKSYEAQTGRTLHLGVNLLDGYRNQPALYEAQKAKWEKVLAGQSYQEIDTSSEGNTFFETHYNLVKNREGQLLGASQIIRDISDRLQTEALWQASERRFAKIFNEALVGFALVEAQSLQIVQANPALGRLLGYALPALQEKKLADLIAASDWPLTLRQAEDLQRLQSHSFSLDQRMNHREGLLRWATVSGTHLFGEEGQSGYLLLMFDDITEQKKAEALLRESEAQKSALIEAFPDTIFHIDREGRVVQLNDKNRLLPYRRQEIIGKSIDDFPVPRKVKLRVKQLLLEAKHKREEGFYEIEIPTPVYTYILETRFVQSTENRVLVIVRDITQRKKEEGRMKELLQEAQRLNRDLEQQYAKIARKEEELARTNQQLRAKNEMLLKMTDELRHSRQELQETLQTLEERNFELDQFVYKTSHDLRSPLSSILGIINLMKIEPDQNRLPDYVERIEGRIVRLDDFIASMLHYSRNNRSEVHPECIDFGEILQECIEDLKYYKNFDRIDIQTWLSGGEHDFYNDGLRVKIIFTNIISNAIKYQDFQKSERFIRIKANIEKKVARLVFEDNGIGIAHEHLEKIYDMFFRATEEAEGSGLGLYIVKQTVDKIKGKIQIFSPGKGLGLRVMVEIPNLNPAEE